MQEQPERLHRNSNHCIWSGFRCVVFGGRLLFLIVFDIGAGAGNVGGVVETKAFVRGELDDFFVGGDFFLTGVDVVIGRTFFVLYGKTTELVQLDFFVTAQCFHDYL